MAKKIVQDVLPPEQRSIRQIPLSERSQSKIIPEKKQTTDTKPVDSGFNGSPEKPKSKKLKYFLWTIGILALLLIIRLFFLSEAEIVIKPKQQTINLNETFLASKELNGEHAVLFEVIKITEEREREAESSGEEYVERKASGEIVIFNEHSSSSQTLVENTRFETPDGLIFRIENSISVPGTTEREGKTIPGQLRVKVFADKPGEEYNIGLADFTIPGFEGLPQFDDFFARSATEMTGGFIGTEKTVDSQRLESIREELQTELNSALKERVALETPDDFLLIDESLQIEFENIFEESVSEELVRIKEVGTTLALILDKKELEKVIVEEALGENEGIKIDNLQDLKIALIDNIENIESLSSFQFNISENLSLTWVIDESSIKNDLLGQPVRNLASLMSKYPSIEEARASMKPFWKRNFPKEEDKIHIEITDND